MASLEAIVIQHGMHSKRLLSVYGYSCLDQPTTVGMETLSFGHKGS